MNAAIYCRVSTDWQAEHGYSLETQESACRARALELGAETVTPYIDDGYTGAYLERPALERLRDALAERLYNVVVVYDPDRLARKLAHQLLLTEEIEKAGAAVVFVAMDFKNTPEGRLFYQIHGSFAEYEREKIRERTMRGKRAKLRAGKVITDSHVYGYDFNKEKSCYELNKGEAAVILRIYDLYISGRVGGADACTVYMNAHPEEFPPPNGKQWNSRTVRAILTREMYTGSYYSNKIYHKKIGPHSETRIIRPREEWIPMTAPAITTRELYEKARERMNNNRTYKTWHRIDAVLLLQGLAYCGNCGRTISVLHNTCKGKKTARYYACHALAPNTKPYSCGARYMDTTVTDELFWETLARICASPETLRDYIGADLPQEMPHPADELERVQAALEKVRGKRRAVMGWFSQSLLSQDEATDKLSALKAQEERLQKALLQLAPAPHAAPLDLGAVCQAVQECPPDIASRRQIVLAVVDRAYILRCDNNYGHRYNLEIRILFKGTGLDPAE